MNTSHGRFHTERGEAGPLEMIERATLRVRTQALKENGVEDLRILSESKFLEVLRGIVGGASHAGALAAPPEPPGCAPQARSQDEYAGRWTALRTRHEESLRKIEGRMEKLSRVFQGIEGAFARLQTAPSGAGARSPAESAERQKTLLREMLLRGE